MSEFGVRIKNMQFKSGILVLIGLALCGCSSHTIKEYPPVAVVNHYVIETDLNQAAEAASQSAAQLAAIEKAKYGHIDALPFESIQDPALDQLLAVKWYGPIAQLLQQIAPKIGYKLQVYGKPPKTPLLVEIDDTQDPVTARQILTNIDLQAKNNASVLIYPQEKIISLRYLGS
ncbi:MAG: hypothetical protein EBX40_01365 [Gammaproteobacteria bacterium]|nr:hypothetical protein [Gammaproteobacteria bacterium]